MIKKNQSNRHTPSPNQQGFFLPKSNINDLKQLFDDNSKRIEKQNMLDSARNNYYESKPNFIDSDNPFDSKQMLNQRNMFDFERAKQKFDSQCSRLKTPQFFKNSSKNSSASKHQRSGGNHSTTDAHEIPFSKQNFNETVQFFDENMQKHKKRDSSYSKKGNSLNLDGLKVSEDDDVSICFSLCVFVVVIARSFNSFLCVVCSVFVLFFVSFLNNVF